MYISKPNRFNFLRAKKHRECVEIFGHFYLGAGLGELAAHYEARGRWRRLSPYLVLIEFERWTAAAADTEGVLAAAGGAAAAAEDDEEALPIL